MKLLEIIKETTLWQGKYCGFGYKKVWGVIFVKGNENFV